MSHGSSAGRPLAATAVVPSALAAVLAAALFAVLTTLLVACDSGANPSAGSPAGQPAAPASPASPAALSPAPPPAPSPADEGLQGRTETNGFFQPMRYTAVDGDTWEGIAAHFRMTPEILKSFNESPSVTEGQVIDLRGVDVPQLGAGGSVTGQDGQGQFLYRASAGDTPAGIASRYGVPLYALRMANLSLLTGREWIPPAGTTVVIPNPPAG